MPIINPACKKKKSLLGLLRGLEDGCFLFQFFTLAPGRDSGSEDGGSFCNVNLGLFKKVHSF